MIWQRLRHLASRVRRAPPAPDHRASIPDLIADLQSRPRVSATWLELARGLARDEQWCWAYLAATEASRLDEGSAASVWLSADCLARYGLAAEGVALLERHELVNGDDPDSLYAVARLGLRARDPKVALPLLDDVLDMVPDHEDALSGKLEMLRLEGEGQRAQELVASLQPGNSAGVLRALARDRIANRDPTRALEYLARTPPTDPDTQVLTARALLTVGRYSEAAEMASEVLRGDPGHRTARKWLDAARRERRVTDLIPVPVGDVRRPSSFGQERILHLVSTSLPYVQAGYTIRSQAIGNSQRNVGLESHFVTPPGFPHSGETEVDLVEDVPYHRLRPGASIEHLDEVTELFASESIDLVESLRPGVLHAHSGFTNCSVALGLGKAYGLPVVYEVRGFLEETWIANNEWASRASDRYRWRREAETRCMRDADAIVTLGMAMRDEIVARGIPADKVTVIPNAIDPGRIESGPKDQVLLESLGIPAGSIVVGYLSSIRRNEGIEYLLEALRRLLDKQYPVRGLIVGSGPELATLRHKAAALGIQDRVVFTGAVPYSGVGSYYRLIDVFVVPRTLEKVNQLVTPLKPYEAMAAGKAVVVSSIPALREMVIGGETGLTFSPEDSVDLARTLEPLLVDHEMREELSRRGREWVIEHRSWSANGEAYRDLYDVLT